MIQQLYNDLLRPHLPRTWGVYHGVAARDVRLLDLNTNFPDYKVGLLSAIEEHAPGRSIELVGLGRGVSTVTALRAGATHVTAYEAADRMITIATETLEANRCNFNDVTIRHALVGDAHNVYGSMDGANVVSPTDLGDADCLVLDCEGAERGILKEMDGRPEIVIVESHPFDDAPTTIVQSLLKDLGYQVSIRMYEPDAPNHKHVLIGVGVKEYRPTEVE